MKIPESIVPDLLAAMTATATRILKSTNGSHSYVDDAPDIAMEAYIALSQYEGEGLETDIFRLGSTIAGRKALNHRRLEGRRAELQIGNANDLNRDLGAEYSGGDPYDIVAAQQALEKLDDLRAEDRYIIEGYYIEGRSMEQLAREESLTEAAMRKRVSRAKQKLEELVNG